MSELETNDAPHPDCHYPLLTLRSTMPLLGPPPYTPPSARRGKASITALPLSVLYRIVRLTLDQRATPSRFSADEQEERVRRIWGIFRGLRGVDRRFYLGKYQMTPIHTVSTSILRDLYLPTYTETILAPYTSSPIPDRSFPANDVVTASVISYRKRETAVLDRFIAIRVGEELRRIESDLSEESGAQEEVFYRFQVSTMNRRG